MNHFGHQLAEAVLAAGNPCCVGIDPHLALLPEEYARPGGSWGQGEREGPARDLGDRLLHWGGDVVRILAEVGVPAVKPQSALFEAAGHHGVRALENIVRTAKDYGMSVVLDAKRGDIGSTATAYATMGLSVHGPMDADSMTVSPYLGPESLTPFIKACDLYHKGIWVLVRTSNPGAELWQLNNGPSNVLAPAYRVAEWVEEQNAARPSDHGLGPIGAVVAATLPGWEPGNLRETMPSTWFLVPGYGAQGATSENLRGHFREDGLGALVVSARGVLFSPDKVREGDDWKDRMRERAQAFVDDMKTVMP